MLITKKHFFISSLFLLITSVSFHCLRAEEELNKTESVKQMGKNHQEQVYKDEQPKISIDSAQYDVGEVYEGDEAVHTFIIKNTGTAQLDISKVRPG